MSPTITDKKESLIAFSKDEGEDHERQRPKKIEIEGHSLGCVISHEMKRSDPSASHD